MGGSNGSIFFKNDGKGRPKLLLIFCLIATLLLAVKKADCRSAATSATKAPTPTTATTKAPQTTTTATKAPKTTTTTTKTQQPTTTTPKAPHTTKAATNAPQTTTTAAKTPQTTTTATKTQQTIPTCITKECVLQAASLINAMDTSVDPCDDFYEYACGGWMKSNTIPDDRAYIERFEQLQETVQIKLKALVREQISSSDIEAVKKMKIMYQSCVDEATISSLGLNVTDSLLHGFGGWPLIDRTWNETNFDLMTILSKMGLYNYNYLINYFIYLDDKNSSVNIIKLDQPMMGMPSRDYFMHGRTSKDLQIYEKTAVDLAVAFGADKATAVREMREMVDFEMQLAKFTLSDAARRDMKALYHKMSIADLQRTIPGINWLGYLQGIFRSYQNLTDQEAVIVYTPSYFKNMLALVKSTKPKTVANYLMWRLVWNNVNKLGKQYRDITQDYRQAIFGIKTEQPFAEMCANYVTSGMGEAASRLYIDHYFDKKAKKRAQYMIRMLRASFRRILHRTKWMDEQTRQYALKKEEDIIEKIAYPDDLKNDTSLNDVLSHVTFRRDTFFENTLILQKDQVRQGLITLRKPVTRDEWSMSPATANAQYNSHYNDITFPAGILQEPFYDKDYPMSLIFGGIGFVIGHEITHGFDDSGRQFDNMGNYHLWWSNSSLAKFSNLSQCFVKQYSNFEVNGDHLNGRNTLGENMADNGGMKTAFEAYRKYVTDKGKEAPLPGLGLSHEQLFFVNVAQAWCAVYRPAALHNTIVTDEHSPDMFRIRGVMSNSKYFSDTFGCKAGSKMNPTHKCEVW